MKIACLGWGSLIWKPENLLIHDRWFTDGPALPIEFTRQSRDGRLTLVLTPKAKPVRTLWALMATSNLNDAKISLQHREGISDNNLNIYIGSISINVHLENETYEQRAIRDWMMAAGLDAVIWTNLPAKFDNENGRVPSLDEAINYLEKLEVSKKNQAEHYVRRAPKQIDTDYRREFEKRWNWSFQSES